MTTSPETIAVEKPIVRCDGNDPALGHPLVYLNMGEKDHVDCPYCSKRFVLDNRPKVTKKKPVVKK